MKQKTTHVRVNRDLLFQKNIKYPEMTPNEVFNIGLKTLNGINKAGEMVWGNVWKRKYGKR